ncbi:thiomuracin/GE37468 family thiazolyl RiPP peptide [Nonomuraea sp. NPDC046570]|uniref:thiomuracin/GE37468 family thiazolyl RiPP peptide n=1 Tax=Nonomuraea sp. NPDC046570 TaxID=3155255 RepID=UPI0033DAA918
MNRNLALDLGAVEVQPLQIEGGAGAVSLESLVGGHAMAEVAASCEVCSCCVTCCCCC